MTSTVLQRHGLVFLLIVVALIWSIPYSQGDTADYVSAVVSYSQGRPGVDGIWEFGHLFWRPLGLVLLTCLKSLSSSNFGLTDSLLLTRAYILVNSLAGVGAGLLLHSLALHLGATRVVAAAVALTFTFANGVLNYIQTGNAYISGLFCLCLGLWLLCVKATPTRAIAGGVTSAAAALLWFPYILVLPAALLAPVFLDARERAWANLKTYRLPAMSVVAASLTIAAAYGLVILVGLGIRSVPETVAWMSSSRHGIQPSLATAVSAVFGIPRGFIEMGSLGKMIKRVMYHDPYAPTSVADVLRTAAPPLLLFYSTALAVVVAAWRAPKGKNAVLLFAVAFLPMLFFATVLFEGGATERFFPVYPFAAIMTAFAFRSRGVQTWLAVVLMIVIVTRSLFIMSPFQAWELQAREASRVASFRRELGPGFVAIMTNQDRLMRLSKTFPFHELNQPQLIPFHCVYDVATKRAESWREDFAEHSLAAWQKSGQVWVSRRLLAQKPLPEWDWVEGNDPRLQWKTGADFFNKFTYEREAGGEDGFLMLQDSAANRRILTEIATGRKVSSL